MEPSNCGCFFYSTNLIYTPCSANVYKWQTSEKCSKDLRCSRLTLNRLKKPNHVWYWRKIAKLCLIQKSLPKVEQSWKDPGPATCLQNFPHTMFRNLHCRMLQNDPEKKKHPKWMKICNMSMSQSWSKSTNFHVECGMIKIHENQKKTWNSSWRGHPFPWIAHPSGLWASVRLNKTAVGLVKIR